MPRETLDRKIRHLLDEILILDSMVEEATLNAVDALKRRDLELARRIYQRRSTGECQALRAGKRDHDHHCHPAADHGA